MLMKNRILKSALTLMMVTTLIFSDSTVAGLVHATEDATETVEEVQNEENNENEEEKEVKEELKEEEPKEEENKDKAIKYYSGLPVTFVAMILPIIYLISYII